MSCSLAGLRSLLRQKGARAGRPADASTETTSTKLEKLLIIREGKDRISGLGSTMVKKSATRKAVEKTRAGKSKTEFPIALGNPANTGGIPTFPQLRLLLSTRRIIVEQTETFLTR